MTRQFNPLVSVPLVIMAATLTLFFTYKRGRVVYMFNLILLGTEIAAYFMQAVKVMNQVG